MSVKSTEDMYPLSPLQQGMLFHSLYAPESGVYCTQFVCAVELADAGAFERAWQQVVDRHGVLRTAFAWQNLRRPLQVVGRGVRLPSEHLDWRGLPEGEARERLEEYLRAERRRGYVLSKAPLTRIAFIRTGEQTYRFVWNHHHMLLDGWSVALLIKEVFAFYEAFRRGQPLQLPQPPPYRDYIAWVQQQDASRGESFWRETLAGFRAPTPLGIDEAPGRPPSQEDVYHTEEMHLPEPLTAALRTFSKRHGLTLNTLAQGAWALLLSRYSGQEDVVFGVTVSGRSSSLAGVESMVGLLINCLPLRLRVPPSASLLPWLKGVQAGQVRLRQFEFSTLTDVQRWSEVPAGLPLFESFLVFENYPVDSSIGAQAHALGLRELRDVSYTNVPLHIRIMPGPTLLLHVTYDGRRLPPARVRRLLGHFRGLFESMVAEPAQTLGALPPTPESERRRDAARRRGARPTNPYEEFAPEEVEQSVASRFESQAAKHGDRVAVRTPAGALTYRELNGAANRCARQILALPAAIERVALLFQHDASMVAAVLGALKAGRTYVPVDPSNPAQRNAFIVDDAQVGAVVTDRANRRLADDLASGARVVIEAEEGTSSADDASNPRAHVSPDAPAYILYTSGSTGRPKGVVQSHRNVLHHIRCYVNGLHICPDDRLTLFSSYSFDAAVMDIFGALLSGASLHPYSVREEGVGGLASWLARNEITVYHSTPTVYRYFTASLGGGEELPHLRLIVLGGEEAHRRDFELYKRHFAPHCIFINGLGPTESTLGLQLFLDKRAELERPSVPVGHPVEQTEVLLLDEAGRPATLYGPGEIAIRSPHLALGYWRRPALTAESFRPDPEGGPRRVYRTGDLGRVLPDGSIEYLGRRDSQVKIRGFRVELGEVEALLNSHAAVRESAVVALGNARGEKRLAAYLVARAAPRPSAEELRGFLKEFLPDHMAPTSFVWLDELPLTPSGKIDRLSLPPLQAAQGDGFAGPRTPSERAVADIWAQVLGLERVGLYDNFFDLGGHSLLATQIVSRIREALRVQVPLRSLFESPNVAGLAAAVEALRGAGESAAAQPGVIPRRSRNIQQQLAELTDPAGARSN
ncbi:MAG TPA: amino acid adenylation domain-containing protein [Pyrinomonadaceae bacterium]|jgi:amino acid adenylation domain-containing protein